jgi:hypothetical protein
VRSMRRASSIVYWSAGVVLVAFGAIAIFSIGAPFLLTGVAMLAVGPRRHDRAVLWPALLGVWGFVIAYVLVAPLSCAGTSVPAAQGTPVVERTSCTNVLGIDYSGAGPYNPPLLPALLAGLAVGSLVAIATRRALRARSA